MSEYIFKGYIEKSSYGENDDAFFLGNKPVALQFYDENLRNKKLSVSYYICDKEKTLEEAKENFVKTLMGFGDADYGDCFSDITGYLWTDETLKIGGHNLLDELESYIGKYCILIVNDEPPESERLK